jgi:hypothetical protein
MILLQFLGLLPPLLGLAAQQPPSKPQVVRRMMVSDELILRVPVRPRPRLKIEWKELKGPKCLDARLIAGAMLSGPSSIDFVLRDRQRVRARMDDNCPTFDYYDVLYLQPDDHRICAKRETIRSRDGGSCRIERFRMLVPELKR